MNYRSDIPYLYGKLNKEVSKNTYTGKETSTAKTNVDNTTNEISVDVDLDDYYTKEQVDKKIQDGGITTKIYLFTDIDSNPDNPPKWILEQQDPKDDFDEDFNDAKLCGILFPNVVSSLLPLDNKRIRYSYLDTSEGDPYIWFKGIELEKIESDQTYYTLVNPEAEPFYQNGQYNHYDLTIYLVI